MIGGRSRRRWRQNPGLGAGRNPFTRGDVERQRRDRIHDPEPHLVVDATGWVVGGLLDPMDDLMCGQFRILRPDQGSDTAHVRGRETRPRERHARLPWARRRISVDGTAGRAGETDDAVEALSQAIDEFPERNSGRVFLALAHYSNGDADIAISQLLAVLLATTQDADILAYADTLDYVKDNLDESLDG